MSDARILDRGYRRYEGPRRGRRGAVSSVARHSALRALGLRRTAWAKMLPIASVLIAYVPAAVFVGVAVLVPEQVRGQIDLPPDYAGYYGFITAAIVLFVAIVGPEVLCPDRRNGMLGLYLASPLDRRSYLVAKVLAVLPVLLLVTLGPPVLLLIGLAVAGVGPSGVGGFALVLLRASVAGVTVALLYTSLSLAAASLTERRAVASAGFVLFLFAASTATGTLADRTGADQRLLLLNPFFVPFELVHRVYGQLGERPVLTTIGLVSATAAWTAAGFTVLWWRYRRLTVTR